MTIAPRLQPPAVPATGWQTVPGPEATGDWHPHVRQLHTHWHARCRDGRLPSRNAVDPGSLRHVLPYMWMLDVQRAPWRFRYRLAGTRFVAMLGFEVTQRWYDEARPQAYAVNLPRLITVAGEGLPTWRRGPMPLESGNGTREVENLMLPLASDGSTVDIILGITVCYTANGTMLE